VASSNPLRELPSVDELLGREELEALVAEHGRPLVLAAARAALEGARDDVQAGFPAGDLVERTTGELAARLRPSLRRVLNATGVVVHTNLGRAPLAPAALERVREVSGGYSNLEYDLESGSRGSRQDHVAALLRELTSAEDALVVNNNAAAVLLALAALAEGREVIVSRGELIEIGDGFRIPDVLTRSGATLVEVGTTNRTRLADYEDAVTERTAALLRVHQSNFRMVGFTEQPRAKELARLADRHGVHLVEDLGSGALVETVDEPTVRASIDAGAHVVTFSGDKLLGGPQAGLLAGRADLIERMRRHPLQRALRADKLTLAALEATLRLVRAGSRDVPVLRMLEEPADAVRARAERLAERTGGTVVETTARPGGGALPLTELTSYACALPPELAETLRRGDPAVVGIVRDDLLLLDCRTLTDVDVDEVAAAVHAAHG
jgi:L-seryl-tRNA(Ser) seleniumtransferase